MDREEAAKELMAMLEEAQEGPYYSEEEVRAHLLEILAPRNQVYMTGDTHGQFERVIEFCARREVEPENTFVYTAVITSFSSHRLFDCFISH